MTFFACVTHASSFYKQMERVNIIRGWYHDTVVVLWEPISVPKKCKSDTPRGSAEGQYKHKFDS